MLGSVMTERKCVRQSGSNTVATTPAVASTCSASPTLTLRPSSRCSSCGTSAAMRSMTLSCNASAADRLTASRTARSAHSALRPRNCASPRM